MAKINKVPLSVVVHTKNAARTLEACLSSVSWASDIVIVDMHSTDETLTIAKKFTDHIITVEDVGFADPMRNYGNSQAFEMWVLVLDADEVVPAGYKELLPKLMSDQSISWYVPRKNILFNKWLEHGNWWPDYQLRFFKKGAVLWTDTVHTLPQANGETRQLEALETNALTHYNYDTIEHFVDRMNRYTSLEVKRRDSITSESALVTAFDDFHRRYFLFQGYRDGTEGLYVSVLQAMYEFTVSLKQWELSNFKQLKANDTLQFEMISRSFRYWFADRKVRNSRSIPEKLYWKIRRRFKI